MFQDTKLSLINFDKLSIPELEGVQKLVNTYLNKINDRCECRELRIELKKIKKSTKGKSILYEFNAQAIISNGKQETIWSYTEGFELYKSLSELLKNLLSETEHSIKKRKDIGKKILREQRKYK